MTSTGIGLWLLLGSEAVLNDQVADLRIGGSVRPGRGFVVTTVDRNGPGGNGRVVNPPSGVETRAILEPGDVIVAIDGQRFRSAREMTALMTAAARAKGSFVASVADVNTGVPGLLRFTPEWKVATAMAIPPFDDRSWIGMEVLPIRFDAPFGYSTPSGEYLKKGEVRGPLVRVADEQPNYFSVFQGGASGWAHRNEAVSLDRAVGYFAARVAADPTDSHAAAMLGVAHLRTGRADEGLASLAAAAQADPDSSFYAELRATALEELGRMDEAAVAHADWRRLSPNKAAADAELARRLPTRERGLAEEGKKLARRRQALAAEEAALAKQTDMDEGERADAAEALDAQRRELTRASARYAVEAEALARDAARAAVPSNPQGSVAPKFASQLGDPTEVAAARGALEDVVGLWEGDGGRTYLFEAGGRFSLPKDQNDVRNHPQAASYAGTWKIDGEEIVSTSREGAYSGMHTNYRKYRLDGDELVVVADWQGSYEAGQRRGGHQEYRLRRR